MNKNQYLEVIQELEKSTFLLEKSIMNLHEVIYQDCACEICFTNKGNLK